VVLVAAVAADQLAVVAVVVQQKSTIHMLMVAFQAEILMQSETNVTF
jgi:hypothetical protein